MILRQVDPHPPALDRGGIRSHRRPRRRADYLAGPHVEPRAVQRAFHDEVVELALAQRPSHMRAPVVQAEDRAVHPEQSDRTTSEGRARRLTLPELALGTRIDPHETESPHTTFVMCASRSAASWVRPASPRIVYRSGLISWAWIRASRTSSSVSPRARAVVGAPMARSAFRTSSQFPPWRYIIMIVPTPHCSPWRAGFFASLSSAWEHLCSLPLAGREDPAIDIATPLDTSAFATNHALSSRRGLIVCAFSIRSRAASSLRAVA